MDLVSARARRSMGQSRSDRRLHGDGQRTDQLAGPPSMIITRSGNGDRPEQAILGALRLPHQRRWEVEESIEELSGLAQAAGASVVTTIIQDREAPSPAFYFGKGKGGELASLV